MSNLNHFLKTSLLSAYLVVYASTEWFTMTGLNLTEIPVHQMTKVGYTRISFYNNKIVSLTRPYFINQTSVEELLLGRNKLSIVTQDAFLGINNSLQMLWLGYNKLKSVGKEFQNLGMLKEIGLRNNDIVQVSDEAFSGSVLHYIQLKTNKITSFPNLTCIASTLQILYLQSNEITHLSHLDLNPLVNLIHLYLADNPFIYIADSSFNALVHLRTLDLSQEATNNLQVLPDLSVLISLIGLEFTLNDGDKFPCDCNTVWLYNIIKHGFSTERALFFVDDKPCVGQLSNQSFVDIDRNVMCPPIEVVVSNKAECAMHCLSESCPEFKYNRLTKLCIMSRNTIKSEETEVVPRITKEILCDQGTTDVMVCRPF